MSASAGTAVNLLRPAAAGDKYLPAVSVVIPVMADNEVLAHLLDRLRGLSVPPDEIVIVDGGSSASCRSLARRFRCIYLGTRPGRGHQLHAGALRASGDVLWFLHADAEPHVDGVMLIRQRHLDGAPGGFFKFRFMGTSTWYKQLLAHLINYRARYGIPYGDQGLFVARAAYDAVGGFADTPLFEEVPLVRELRRRGRFAPVDASIGVSPRRWERDGWLRRSVANRMLVLAYSLGVPPNRLARRYRPLGPTEIDAEPDSW
ncbi:MAG: TIGR04283 family arsenosugar biosynthesis glycosyltransferase [Gammaproteobacteria bacterium]|nr:TIGR04283 family arsenosugar biosynthesis glycosyltransferase [Gammaproteobacteria bacterium]